MTTSTSRVELLGAAQSFCEGFAQGKDLDTILSYFSDSQDPMAIEHGLPILAPFLGRPFTGKPGIRQYFTMLADLLTYENMRFSEYVVDPDVRKVSVKGQAKFAWKKTGNSWDETFTYTLDFDGQGKVARYQVWADSGAAYLARIGELDSYHG
ncbi:hypothetical protein EW146_g3103 [Bondarzewia mesenterica]|uniref:SnoaL-like domain-containing protein n=1 Tax=Bondarzewia mesenterica TaxID=1095465 RepID=A0A4S4M0H4_9AGAM|nr:hypothetical protein EW146_g3103 [Bondarzewia mesenterica]